MFDSLSDYLDSVVSKLCNRARLSQADIDEILGEARTALLECDSTLDGIRVHREA